MKKKIFFREIDFFKFFGLDFLNFMAHYALFEKNVIFFYLVAPAVEPFPGLPKT